MHLRLNRSPWGVSTIPIYAPEGEQALLWQVILVMPEDEQGFSPGLSVFLDAQTGEVLYISEI